MQLLRWHDPDAEVTALLKIAQYSFSDDSAIRAWAMTQRASPESFPAEVVLSCGGGLNGVPD